MDDKSNTRMAEKKDKLEAQVKSADMTDEMQQQAIEVALEAMEKFTIEKACNGGYFPLWYCENQRKLILDHSQDIAQYIKKEVDHLGYVW
ncbi:MAG: hypothetical protein Q9186_003481 [Xanthomendoza sp. 1 TL-2023]